MFKIGDKIFVLGRKATVTALFHTNSVILSHEIGYWFDDEKPEEGNHYIIPYSFVSDYFEPNDILKSLVCNSK